MRFYSDYGLFWFKVIDENGSVVPQGQEGNLGIRVKPDRPFSLFTEYTVHLPFLMVCTNNKAVKLELH